MAQAMWVATPTLDHVTMPDVSVAELDEQCSMRILILAAVVVVVSAALSPVWISANDYVPTNSPLVLVAPLLLAAGAVVGVTILQVRANHRPTTFAPRLSAIACISVSIACAAIGFLGFVGAFIMILLLPAASAMLAVAWVQPLESWTALTAALGIAVLPFAVWFAGRADEYLVEAVFSGAFVALVLAALGVIRQRRSRRGSPS